MQKFLKPQYRVEIREQIDFTWKWFLYRITTLHVSEGQIKDGDELVTEGHCGQFSVAASRADQAINHHFKLWHREQQEKELKHAS